MDNPNYYGILPANVRYDKNLKPMEKILYTELTALSNKNGYCKAQNSYFAKLYDVHKNTAGSWINNLEKSGYIKSKLIYAKDKEGKTTKQVIERRIYIISNPINGKIDSYQSKECEPVNKNIDTPINEKMEEINNNTSNEYYKNNKKREREYIETSLDKVKEKIQDVFGHSVAPPVLDTKTSKILDLLKKYDVEFILKTLEKIKTNEWLKERRKKIGDINYLNYILGLEKFTDIAFGGHDPLEKKDSVLSGISEEDLNYAVM